MHENETIPGTKGIEWIFILYTQFVKTLLIQYWQHWISKYNSENMDPPQMVAEQIVIVKFDKMGNPHLA